MAITKALVFNSVTVNGVSMTPHLTESAEVTVEPVNETVRDNQTLASAWDVSFSVTLNSDTPATDANVYTNSAATPVLTWIRFDGATGSSTLNITNVYITATPVFGGERTGYQLTGTKRVTVTPVTIT